MQARLKEALAPKEEQEGVKHELETEENVADEEPTAEEPKAEESSAEEIKAEQPEEIKHEPGWQFNRLGPCFEPLFRSLLGPVFGPFFAY